MVVVLTFTVKKNSEKIQLMNISVSFFYNADKIQNYGYIHSENLFNTFFYLITQLVFTFFFFLF